MKSKLLPFLAALALGLSAITAVAHEDGHTKKAAGPNGGRILSGGEPRAEFFVTTDRKVQITFLDHDGKPIAPTTQVIVVTAGERSAPTTLTFSKSGESLVSDVAFPAGDDVPTVVQIKQSPDEKASTNKFNVNLSKCSECKKAEYACTCGH